MRQVFLAGVLSRFPALSIARTWKVWLPFLRLRYVFGEPQLLKAPRSSLHWKREPFSVEANLNVAVRAVVRAAGPLIIRVFGATVSGHVAVVRWRVPRVERFASPSTASMPRRCACPHWRPVIV